MKPLNDVLNNWTLLAGVPVKALRESRHDGEALKGYSNIRSGLWKRCLLFKSDDGAEWVTTQKRSRSEYSKTKSRLVQRNPDELDSFEDPLSGEPGSHWETIRKDEGLRQEILQDVDRCMPENLYFRQPETQTTMVDILFAWSKEHLNIGYRQGMHEILAPIVWAVERDAIDPASIQAEKPTQDTEVVKVIFDPSAIEADSFSLFEVVMKGIASAYESSQPAKQNQRTVSEPPMIARSRRIFDDFLSQTDPGLSSHLKDIDLLPQVFLMRWLRLLLGREFDFDNVLYLWDSLFARDPSMQSIDLICVALLLRLRWQLMECDNSEALSLLVKPAGQSMMSDAASLVDDAIYLQTHLNFDGGSQVVLQRTGRGLPLIERPTTPSTPQMKASTGSEYSPAVSTKSPSNPFRNAGSFEGLLQDAARGVYQRGEKLGINKAVREAVGEVRKNVRDIQANRLSHSRSSSSTGPVQDGATLLRRIEDLEVRNKSLGKMLESAVADLWNQHEELSKSKAGSEEGLQSLAMGIAKVQLTQVYLEDSTMPLPPAENDTKPSVGPAKAATNTSLGSPALKPTRITTPAQEPRAYKKANHADEPNSWAANERSLAAKVKAPGQSQLSATAEKSEAEEQTKSRPPLQQSSFSWMLGQDSTSSARSTFMSASPFTDSARSNSNRPHAYLFGDSEEPSKERRGSTNNKAKSDKQKQSKSEGDEDTFRMDTVGGKSG